MAVFKTTAGKDPVKDSTATYAAGDMIFSQGDLGTEMFIIQDGEVEIIKHINGESHILSHLEKGDFFGEMALLEAAPRTADATDRSGGPHSVGPLASRQPVPFGVLPVSDDAMVLANKAAP